MMTGQIGYGEEEVKVKYKEESIVIKNVEFADIYDAMFTVGNERFFGFVPKGNEKIEFILENGTVFEVYKKTEDKCIIRYIPNNGRSLKYLMRGEAIGSFDFHLRLLYEATGNKIFLQE